MLATAPATASPPDYIVQAEYTQPTDRYDHGVLGDAVEWGALVLTVDMCIDCEGPARTFTVTFRLPENRVFEDIAPRIFTGEDGLPIVMVVETDLTLGARLALYDETGLITATPFIGRNYRWLAPIGAADLDGDGQIEIAYIDRPHLAKQLKVWRLSDGRLSQIATQDNLSNHQIGWDFIPGGLRDCGQGPEMVVASGDWSQVKLVRLDNGKLFTTTIGPYRTPSDLTAALNCPN
ncbi:MAG TPA: VCBS repeat-containing protein [Aliiroseovarius sp.]|nr:VCBS repeat-containing protein [Aliiroseovarius sp.]